MKFHNKKWKALLTKGLALVLLVNAICAAMPPLVAEAASSSIAITEAMTKDYYSYMVASGYTQDKTSKSKDRIVLLSEFLHSKNSEIKAIPSDKRDDYETNRVVWNPSQDKVNDGRDLYFLQWTNGDGYTNPGEGYEILSRLVYLTTDGEIRYSKQVNIDDYPRSLLDTGHEGQWDNKRINQCYFAVPEDCAQIVGLTMVNQSGGGDNNDTWWMDNLYIYRLDSDDVSEISERIKNGRDHYQVSFQSGRLVAYVSGFDIDKRYLGTDDTREEWLYLLQAPESTKDIVSSASTYYAQIVTGNSDLSGKNLTLEITYTDITGKEHTYTHTVTDRSVTNFYPTITIPTEFDISNNWENNVLPLAYFDRILMDNDGEWEVLGGFRPILSWTWDHSFSNYIAMEQPKGKSVSKGVRQELDSYGNFHTYNWETSNTTVTNLYAWMIMGNYVDSRLMEEDMLGPYTATDVRLDITDHIQSITQIKIYKKAGEDNAELQDVRIYTSSSDYYNQTRMNGGIGTERIFYDVKDALCIASLDQERPIQLSGNRQITCTPDPEPYVDTSYRLIQHTATRLDLMGEDDNLGVQISLADIYNAGFEIFMSKISDSTRRLPHKDYYERPDEKNLDDDIFYKMSEIRTFLLEVLPEKTNLIERATALELLNLMESYYKECLNLHIRYKDDLGSLRDVNVPFVTSYVLQIYSDNNGRLGTTNDTLLTGILQQGEDVGLRVPLSQYSELVDITLSFGKSTAGIENYKNNKHYYLPNGKYTNVSSDQWEEAWTSWDENYSPGDKFLSRAALKEYLGETESIEGGKTIPTGETIAIRAIRLYENVTKEEFSSVYDPNKRVLTLRTTRDCDYYYQAGNKRGTSFAVGSEMKLSLAEGTLIKGTPNYSAADMKNMYLVELNTQSLFFLGAETSSDLFVTLSYTTNSGEEKKVSSQRLSELSKDYTGGVNIDGLKNVEFAYAPQTAEALRTGAAYFLLELEDISRFNYIHLNVPGGETEGVQINSVYIYQLFALGSRYSSPKNCAQVHLFTRDFVGDTVAYNNKPVTLQPDREGSTFYFTKVNSDGTTEEPDTDYSYTEEYLKAPPTSMTYEETLKNLGLSVVKYTYTVEVNVANVLDAGSGNYFYFQLVFENGTSGVVLANQQLASDSFRQGYTESFTINTTQNFGNVTGVRIICDTTSSTSQAFDKLNIDSITVSLPSQGGAKSWIIDKVGWIDINFQDEGVATTITADGRNGGFPNSQVVKEYPKTRTASTARLLFKISTAADSAPRYTLGPYGDYEASIVYEDTAGYTQQYNFDLRSVMYNFMESEDSRFLFNPNESNMFTVAINDIVSVKSLNIYRNSSSGLDWIIKDVTISQFSDIGDVYKSITGEFMRYMENETLLATSTNNNLKVADAGTGTFTFSDHSISINTIGNDPATWTTTVTRIPATAKETLNVYLYAGSTADRTYTFNPESIPTIKGRLEYTYKDGGSVIGSEAFTFTDSGTINGTTVLKATGLSVTGMNQLKTLHLEGSSASVPIISGARVERIRENTILETLYFDYGNAELSVGKTYSTAAQVDTLASKTKQMLSLQLSSDQQQLFTASSDVAVALLYTSENSSSESKKMVYSTPYVFFTDLGITSLGNASILQIPFEISGVDHIAGISVVSNGPIVRFENAIAYNYVENTKGDRTLIDTCQIAQKFNSSTVEKQLMKEANANVTPITISFTTSDSDKFSGAGTSGRLPLTIHYRTLTGEDQTLAINNFSSLLPANTLLSAGSKVSFPIQLSNFSHLTSIELNAPDDDWHLNKVSAEINNIANTTSTSQLREAYVDSWITSKTPATAIFNTGNDSETVMNQIISFSVTGQTSASGTVAAATSGSVLQIQANPGEQIRFTPLVTVSGSPNNTVVWDTSQYGDLMMDGGNNGLTFNVPADSIGQVYSFTSYCSFDPSKVVAIAIEIVEYVPPTVNGGTTDGTTGDTTNGTTTQEEVSVNVDISINNGGVAQSAPSIPSFSAEEGTEQSYSIFVKPGENTGIWSFEGTANLADHTVTFSSADLTVDSTPGTHTTTMICTDANGAETFRVTFNVHVVDLQLTITATGDGITPTTITLDATSDPYTFTIPYNESETEYQLVLTDNHAEAKSLFSGIGNTLTFLNRADGTYYPRGTTITTTNAICAPIEGTGYSLSIPITIKVAD